MSQDSVSEVPESALDRFFENPTIVARNLQDAFPDLSPQQRFEVNKAVALLVSIGDKEAQRREEEVMQRPEVQRVLQARTELKARLATCQTLEEVQKAMCVYYDTLGQRRYPQLRRDRIILQPTNEQILSPL